MKDTRRKFTWLSCYVPFACSALLSAHLPDFLLHFSVRNGEGEECENGEGNGFLEWNGIRFHHHPAKVVNA